MMVSLLLSLVFVSQESRAAEEVSIPEWHGAISAIIRTRCGTCHAPDSVGPFPLLEYGQVKRRSTFIRHVVAEGLMPPWLPSQGGAELLTSRQFGIRFGSWQALF